MPLVPPLSDARKMTRVLSAIFHSSSLLRRSPKLVSIFSIMPKNLAMVSLTPGFPM